MCYPLKSENKIVEVCYYVGKTCFAGSKLHVTAKQQLYFFQIIIFIGRVGFMLIFLSNWQAIHSNSY